VTEEMAFIYKQIVVLWFVLGINELTCHIALVLGHTMTMYGVLNHIGCATLLKQQIGLEATRSIKRTSILVCVYGLIVTYAA
jgi:hypothetical protein